MDARFEDGGEQPLRLITDGPEDLAVIAALVQDAVCTTADLRWSRRERRFDLLLNRFRWEDRARAEAEHRPFERVRAVLGIRDVSHVASQGIVPGDGDTVLSLLSLVFTPGEDGTGHLDLVFSGDGALRLSVECVNLVLADVTRPYRAPSGQAPAHPEG